MFINDYVKAIKLCQVDLYYDYVDSTNRFSKEHFQHFSNIVPDYSHKMQQDWVTDLNIGEQFLLVRIESHSYPTHPLNFEMSSKSAITQEIFDVIVSHVKA